MGEEDSKDEVRTLFIAGLPDDVKEREIHNLFRTARGFETCQLKYTGRGYQIVAFALFSDQASALAAKDALHVVWNHLHTPLIEFSAGTYFVVTMGIIFDPSSTTTLHIELARSNSRVKRSRADDGFTSVMEKKPRVPAGVPASISDSGVGGTMHMPGLGHPVYSDMSGYPPPQSGGMVGAPYGVQDGIPGMGPTIIPPLGAPGNNPPCSTLFIANLSSSCTETELTQVLTSFPGILKIKMQMRGGFPVAFAEFQDEFCSTQALRQLQNAVLPSSDRGGMHLEYAKSRMGLPKRDRRF